MVARGVRRLAVPLLVGVLVCGVLFLGVFPTRTYLNQRESIAEADARLDELESTNEGLQNQRDLLQRDEEIERIAREQYGLAKPGEEVYHLLPPPQDPVQVPDAWPFNRLDQQLGAPGSPNHGGSLPRSTSGTGWAPDASGRPGEADQG
jgi:cell division protein FtsB